MFGELCLHGTEFEYFYTNKPGKLEYLTEAEGKPRLAHLQSLTRNILAIITS